MFDISVVSEGGVAEQVYDSGPTFSQYFHSFIRITLLSPLTSPIHPKYVIHCHYITSIPLNTPLHSPSPLFTEWLGIDDVQATMSKGESLSNQPDNEYLALLSVVRYGQQMVDDEECWGLSMSMSNSQFLDAI